MAIETFEFIDDLNAANPTATDNVSEGDDHLRGLKTTLKNTFPNVTGAINATETELNYVDGVTSAIQTQLDAKQESATAVSKSSSTGEANIPAGTTAQRGSGAAGQFRYNSTTGSFEGYGSSWGSVGGGATGAGGDAVFVENELIVTTDYTLSTNKSAMSVGPVTVNSGVSVSIPSGHTWVVL